MTDLRLPHVTIAEGLGFRPSCSHFCDSIREVPLGLAFAKRQFPPYQFPSSKHVFRHTCLSSRKREGAAGCLFGMLALRIATRIPALAPANPLQKDHFLPKSLSGQLRRISVDSGTDRPPPRFPGVSPMNESGLSDHQPQTGSARLPLSTSISKPTLSGCYEDLLLIKATFELLVAWQVRVVHVHP
jgi:hypothetical protein